MRQLAAYDDYADWYEEFIGTPYYERVDALLASLIGSGQGVCLDLCCGTGARAAPLRKLGWTPVGVDLSRGQLGYASARLPVVLGDAAALPLRSSAVQAVACVLGHTDLPDYAAVLRETGRVLKPGGRFAHVGVHPCFVGAFADRSDPAARVVIDPRYADRSLSFDGPAAGVRVRVGAWHVPLADLLNGVLAAGLRLVRTVESGDLGVPDLFGFLAERAEEGTQ